MKFPIKGAVVGWYRLFNEKTKGLKKLSRDFGRILTGNEADEVLDNAQRAKDIVTTKSDIAEIADAVVEVVHPEKKKRGKKKE